MKLKRLLAALMSLCVFALCTGCDDDSDNSSDTTTTTPTTTTTTENETTTTTTTTESTTTTTTTATASEAGASNIEISDAQSTNTTLTSGSATVTIGDKQITLNGAYIIDGIEAEIVGGSYESTSSDQNVFLVINGGSLEISNAVINKTGDASSNDSERTSDVSDDYNFYGLNSVILVVGEGSSAEIENCTINSESSGANAIFATESAEVDVENVEITTNGNSSRGVYATYEGEIEAEHLTITTSGAHCAPIATDRGGGYVSVEDSIVTSSGDGSPSVYSTGEIYVENVIGTSGDAQAAVIEGKNSITMVNCEFTVNGGSNAVMLYQSMSGDAADSDATSSCSTLTMKDTTITNNSDGVVFYITNTSSIINLSGTNTFSGSADELISAATGNWGNSGSKGGTLTLNADGQTLTGSISADDISSVSVTLSNGSTLTGSTSGSVTVNEE
ncbi:MAG: hypothetical protein LUH57_02775 [Ruminococcus sp.]|nr:hypothetical protein [Ruminococcus sp.]